jgi:hypothetical protein
MRAKDQGNARSFAQGFWLALPWLWSICYLFPPLNHDAAAILQFADRMLGGERLYVDLIDFNPPITFWLDLPAVFAAHVLGLETPIALVVYFLILFALILGFAQLLIGRLLAAEAEREVLMPAILFCALVYPGHSFAQREHLLFTLAIPYAVIAVPRSTGQATARLPTLIAALLIAFAVCMKPHFGALPLAVELYVLWCIGLRKYLVSITPWVIAATGAIYLAAVFRLAPEYVSAMLPLVTRYYAEEGPSLLDLVTGDQVPALLAAIVVLGGIAFLNRDMVLGRILTLLTIGATVAGMLQDKGWDYHFLAARSFAIVLFTVTVASLADRMIARKGALVSAIMAGLFVLSGVLSPPFQTQRAFAASPAGRLLPIIREHAQGKPVLWLTTSIYPQFPVLDYTGSKLAMPFMSLWLLPALYKTAAAVDGHFVFTEPAAMSPAESLVFNSVADGLTKLKPALIVVTRSSDDHGFGGVEFDYLGYFQRNPEFAAEFAHYTKLTTLSGWTIYQRSVD